MIIMSPTCCILSLPGPLSMPHSLQLFKDNVSLDAASSLVFTALAAKAHAQPAAPAQAWLLPLQQLEQTASVERGTAAELSAYQGLVRRQIEAALAGVAGEQPLGLSEQLQKALRHVNEGKTSQGHAQAVELLGFAGLAGLAAMSGPTSSCSSGGGSLFKVPALPSKKRSRDEEVQQQQASCKPQAAQPFTSFSKPQPGGQQQQQRKHSAPKRRATPQVLPGAPICLTPNTPPASASHGDAVCDEQLLSCWCPISGKRQRTSDDGSSDMAGVAVSSTSSVASSDSGASSSGKVLLQAVPARQQQQPADTSSKPLGSETISSLSGVSSAPAATAVPAPFVKQQQQQGMLPPKSCVNGSSSNGSPSSSGKSAAAAARAASHAEAAESLRRLIHEDPRHSRPAADVLLFGKTAQQPIKNWTGVIKHKHAGRVVELCTVTLQVPEPFLEEFPAALYAADVRHRRSVSLGRHVVCRASLGTLSEHQLAGLSAMARGQLVALCSLQTAELHLVPYFDNRNLVRMVGFLKIKSE